MPPSRLLGESAQAGQWPNGRVVVKSAPRATGAIARERAGPERASRGGVSLARFQSNSEGPCRGTSPAQGGIAREGGSEGCARCAARATAPGPRGKTEASRSENKEKVVEAGGIEPPSGRLGPLVSPCAAYVWFSSRRLGVGSRPSRPARAISTAAAGRSGGPACFGVAVIRFAGGSRRSRRGCG